MTGFEKSKKIIFNSITLPETEEVSVRESHDRVLAGEIKLQNDYPGRSTSAIDGFALRFGGSNTFKKIATIAAGDISGLSLGPGECAAVMTGGLVPDGTDCIAMVEHCTEQGDEVTVNSELRQGEYINGPGSEARQGDTILCSGLRIHRTVYPALFYAGAAGVTVYKQPRIGLLVTGNELREVEDGPAPGQVFNTNQYILESFLSSAGLSILMIKQVNDNKINTRNTLREMSEECDFIITSGGVSMGRYDFIKKILQEEDYSLILRGTDIKPGRHLIVAERSGRLFFAMPGYPSAFLTNAILYVLPALKKASGRSDYDHTYLDVTLGSSMSSRKGKNYFNRAVLEITDGAWTASGPGSQKTSHFLNFAGVNGLVMLPESVGDLKPGDCARAIHFDSVLS